MVTIAVKKITCKSDLVNIKAGSIKTFFRSSNNYFYDSLCAKPDSGEYAWKSDESYKVSITAARTITTTTTPTSTTIICNIKLVPSNIFDCHELLAIFLSCSFPTFSPWITHCFG